MDQQQTVTFSSNLDSLFTNLEDFSKKEGVLGKPVTFGEKTLVPIVSVTLGYGSGNSAAKNQMGNGGTTQTASNQGSATNAGMGALGLGAKISTDAVIVIDKDNVSLLPIDQKANMGQMMDKLPQILASMGQGKGQQGQQGQGQNQ